MELGQVEILYYVRFNCSYKYFRHHFEYLRNKDKSRQLRYWYLILYNQVPDVKCVMIFITKIRDESNGQITSQFSLEQIFEHRNPSHSNIAVKGYVISQRLKSWQ